MEQLIEALGAFAVMCGVVLVCLLIAALANKK